MSKSESFKRDLVIGLQDEISDKISENVVAFKRGEITLDAFLEQMDYFLGMIRRIDEVATEYEV